MATTTSVTEMEGSASCNATRLCPWAGAWSGREGKVIGGLEGEKEGYGVG